MKNLQALQPAFSDELEIGGTCQSKQDCTGASEGSAAPATAQEVPIPQPEASSIPAEDQPVALQPEASLEPALQLSAQAKPKPIEELSAKEANDMTCAICLDQIPVQELCAIKGCDHVYCGKCILAWTVHRDPPTCPQCKAPFASLLTFRKLDGTMSDYAVEESVCLLKRAHWFEAYLKEVEKGKGRIVPMPEHLGAAAFTADDAREWQEWQEYSQDYSRYEYEIDEDDEVEAYYFSSAAGHKRILGNRRFGENGFISSGRMQARPVAQSSRSGSKGKAKASPGASASKPAACASPAVHTGSSKSVGTPLRSRGEGAATPVQKKTGSKQAACETPDSGGGKGRRAHRKEKRASADARARMLASP